MKELGEAIDESLSNSESIAHVVSGIKRNGYDVFLVLEVTAGFTRQGSDEDDIDEDSVRAGVREKQLVVSAQDLQFLRALHIVA